MNPQNSLGQPDTSLASDHQQSANNLSGTTTPQMNQATPKAHRLPKKWPVVGIVVLVVVAGAYFWHSTHNTPKAIPLTKVSVQLEWVNNPEFAGMYVAQDLGYYREAGLDVNLKEFQATTDVNEEVASGKADYGVSTPLEIILGRDKGQKTKAIAAIYQTSAYAIASLKTAGINTPADFKGKILGNSGDNNQAKVTYAALIANAGLTPTDARVKAVDFDIVKVFTEKQADTFDMYRSDQPYLLDKANIAYNEIFPEQYGFGIYGDVLTTSDAKVSQNPDQVRAFTQATLKGWQYAVDHQAETLTILAKHANELYKDPAYLRYGLSHTLPLIPPTGNRPLGSMQYSAWSRAHDGVRTAHLLKNSFDVTDAYTSEFVR